MLFKPDVIVGFEFERKCVILIYSFSNPADALFLVSGDLFGETSLNLIFAKDIPSIYAQF